MAVACPLAALERALFEASLDRLPVEALEAVLMRVPADSRARAACVSRAWRAAIACPKMWHTLDLTISGVSLSVQELARVVDSALLHKLPKLVLSAAGLGAEHVPELARLLRGSTSLRHLLLQPVGQAPVAPLFTAANVALFADALRDNTSLKHLTLSNLVPSWRCAAPAVCAALAGHPSLESLLLWEEVIGLRVNLSTLDAALAGLLNADAPALRRLELSFDVKATGQPRLKLPLMFAALARNTHLRALKVGSIASTDAAFRSSVVPAMEANTGLREACIVPDDLRDLSEVLLRQLEAAMSHLKTYEEQD